MLLSKEVAIVELAISAIAMLLSFVWKPLKRKDRLGNNSARASLAFILVTGTVVYTFDLSYWWLLLSLLPLGYYGYRWNYFNNLVKTAKNAPLRQRDIARFELIDRLLKSNLYEWEIREFLLPNLIILFNIGAIKKLNEALASLSDYKSTSSYKELHSLTLSISHQSREMTDYLNTAIKTKLSEKDKEYPLFLNNLYHSAMVSGDSIAIDAVFSKIETYVTAVEDKTLIPWEMLDAMMYRYDITNNSAGIAKVRALIAERKPRSFQEYLNLGDIELFYNRRHNDLDAIRSYLDEVLKKLEEMVKDEESRIRFKLRIIPLYIELNYGWKEITNDVFNNAATYLNYSEEIAFEYLKMLVRIVNDVDRLYGLHLYNKQETKLMREAYLLGAQYMDSFKAQIFQLNDCLLYRKRDAYRLIIAYAQIGVYLGGSIDEYARQLIASSHAIISLCRKNDETSELIHSLMSYIDEFLVLKAGLQTMEGEELKTGHVAKGLTDAITRVTAEEQNVKDYLAELKSFLKHFNYDRSLAYPTLWTANFCAQYGDTANAKFLLQKFEEHNLSVKHYTAQVQNMYAVLKSFLQSQH